MPIYDYRCESCGQRTEVFHGINASGPEQCPNCGKGPMRKLLAPPAIHFKGTGWAKKERAASRPTTRSTDEGSKPADSGGGPAKEPAGEGAAKEAKTAPSSGDKSTGGGAPTKSGSGEG